MPNSRFSELPAAAVALPAMELGVNDAGVSRKLDLAQIVPPFLRFTPPPQTGWSWFNQDAATNDILVDGIYLDYPRTATAAFTMVGLARSVPATPWTVKAAVQPSHLRIDATAAYQGVGIGLRESGTGKLDFLQITENPYTTPFLYFENVTATSPTAGAIGVRAARKQFLPSVVWVAISDDGANIKFYHSFDGRHWHLFTTKARASHMAGGPDQAIFFVNDSDSPVGFVAAGNLFSWEVTASGTP